jgi:hypothetical protein
MNNITKGVRIKKDYFLNGFYSIHVTKYRDGNMIYESTLGYFKKKKDAEKLKADYIKGRAVKLAYPNLSYKQFIAE